MAFIEPISFAGRLSLGDQSVDVTFTVGIDASGKAVIEFADLAQNARTNFIDVSHAKTDPALEHFDLQGSATDGSTFRSKTFSIRSVKWGSDASGVFTRIEGSASEAVLTQRLAKPANDPVLRWLTRGLEDSFGAIVETPLGRLRFAGQQEVVDPNLLCGSITLQPDQIPENVEDWRAEGEKLLEHVRRIACFATSSVIKTPIREFYRGEVVERSILAQSRQMKSGMPVIHPNDREGILKKAVQTFKEPGLVDPGSLLFPIEWFAMDPTYSEVRLINAMTAIENLVDTHLDEKDSLIESPADFERTRRALRKVISACLEKWTPESKNDVLVELNEKLQELNRRSFRNKVEALAEGWQVPLSDIADRFWAAKKARDRIVHRGAYYEHRKENEPDLWNHVTIVREVVVRFILAALRYRGSYCTYVDGYRIAEFPPRTA